MTTMMPTSRGIAHNAVQPPARPLTYTVTTAASEKELSPKTIRRAIARGDLKAIKIGTALRIKRDDLDRWFDSQELPTAGRKVSR